LGPCEVVYFMRKILIILLIVTAGQGAYAQVKGFVGLKGGGHLSTAYIEHTIYNTFMNTGFIPGYQGGLMLKLFTNRSSTSFLNAGLQSGLAYEQKGWKQTFATDEPTYHIKMSYLNFPVEAMAYAGKGNTKFFFTLGMFTEWLVNVEKDPDPNPDNMGTGVEFYTYEESRDRTFGYGVRLSLGVQHEFPFGAIHLDGFISYSVSSLMKTEDLDNRLPDLSNHYLAGFTVAYMIPFGKMDF